MIYPFRCKPDGWLLSISRMGLKNTGDHQEKSE